MCCTGFCRPASWRSWCSCVFMDQTSTCCSLVLISGGFSTSLPCRSSSWRINLAHLKCSFPGVLLCWGLYLLPWCSLSLWRQGWVSVPGSQSQAGALLAWQCAGAHLLPALSYMVPCCWAVLLIPPWHFGDGDALLPHLSALCTSQCSNHCVLFFCERSRCWCLFSVSPTQGYKLCCSPWTQSWEVLALGSLLACTAPYLPHRWRRAVWASRMWFCTRKKSVCGKETANELGWKWKFGIQTFKQWL